MLVDLRWYHHFGDRCFALKTQTACVPDLLTRGLSQRTRFATLFSIVLQCLIRAE